jgi:RNA polymerase sigma factor (TIGR02999 family)
LRLAEGEDLAVGLLWSRIHERVREMAARALLREGHEPSIEPTDVVGEVFMRLHGGRDAARPWEGRGHFFGSVARAISQLLVDRARRRKAMKRCGTAGRVPLETLVREGGLAVIGDEPGQVEAVHEALEALSAVTPRAGEVAFLRFVIGLTTAQTAETLGISRRTVDLDWAFARAWLRARLAGEL